MLIVTSIPKEFQEFQIPKVIFTPERSCKGASVKMKVVSSLRFKSYQEKETNVTEEKTTRETRNQLKKELCRKWKQAPRGDSQNKQSIPMLNTNDKNQMIIDTVLRRVRSQWS